MAASVNRKLLSDALLTLTLLLRCCLSMFGSTKVTSSNRIPFLRMWLNICGCRFTAEWERKPLERSRNLRWFILKFALSKSESRRIIRIHAVRTLCFLSTSFSSMGVPAATGTVRGLTNGSRSRNSFWLYPQSASAVLFGDYSACWCDTLFRHQSLTDLAGSVEIILLKNFQKLLKH